MQRVLMTFFFVCKTYFCFLLFTNQVSEMDSGIRSLESEKLLRLESEFSNLLLQINSELELRKQNETGESFSMSLSLL